MSGICGILRLDGALPEGLEAMAAQMQTRGPDGTHLFRNGSCGLGHTLLATTPEALIETLPLTHPETGCTITADLRLDNRDALCVALKLADLGRVIGDGEIVLNAYLRWGEMCPDHLLGDFAFAIWDPRKQRLFCARDHMGMKQLIWTHIPGRVLAFASAPSTVLRAEGVPRRINDGRVADFLEGYLEGIDFTSTFFEGVERLPPAHRLTVDARGARVKRYWQLQPGPELKLGSDAEYADAFLEVFTRSVRARLRAPEGTVGSMLSGGMDSGSIVAIAARIFAEEGHGPFPTFSAIGPDPESCIETRTIHDALKMPNLDPHLVNWADMERYATQLVALTDAIEEPFDGHMTLLRAIYFHARQAGLKVVLDGGGGDLAFTNGDHIPRLFRQFRWGKAWTETVCETELWNDPRPAALAWLAYMRRGFTPGWVRRGRRAARKWRSRPKKLGLCTPEFARLTDLAGRQSRERDEALLTWRPLPEARAHTLQRAFTAAGRERYSRTAAECGIEPRDPFVDTSLVAFCLSLPQHHLTERGWPKSLLRYAMCDHMPDSVRWRRGKEHLGWTFTRALAPYLAEAGSSPWLNQRARLPHDPSPRAGSAGLENRLELNCLTDWHNRLYQFL